MLFNSVIWLCMQRLGCLMDGHYRSQPATLGGQSPTAPQPVYVIYRISFLCRWNFIIHGCIDGHSRLITYLKCSDHNRADTVFQCFREAIRQYELPYRVRSDHGGENVRVAEYMLLHPERRAERNSFITGRSVHNSCIERLWHDVF